MRIMRLPSGKIAVATRYVSAGMAATSAEFRNIAPSFLQSFNELVRLAACCHLVACKPPLVVGAVASALLRSGLRQQYLVSELFLCPRCAQQVQSFTKPVTTFLERNPKRIVFAFIVAASRREHDA